MDEFDPTFASSEQPIQSGAPFDNDDFVQLDTPKGEAVTSSRLDDEAAEEDLYTGAPLQSSEAEPSVPTANLLGGGFEDQEPISSTTDLINEEPECLIPDTNVTEPVEDTGFSLTDPPEETKEPAKTGGIFDGLQKMDTREMQEASDFDGKITEDTVEECVGDEAVVTSNSCSQHKVVELIYWRDPKKSGIVFGSCLFLLLSLSFNSLISVVAYLSLAVLTVTISFRVYKTVLQAVQKTGDSNPFKPFLDVDVELPRDKVDKVVDNAVEKLNCLQVELRRLFLVEDLVDSIKFAVMLWLMTYIGAWFNGLTLLILGFIGLFTIPKVYELHQEKIDNYIDLVNQQVKEIMNKVQAKVPWLKKKTA
ncbi:reticulon-like protein isoform X1 [Saccoglossus kowalevskii]|uniref:Reticulon-like protein n=1 Tax=Saccoglossus kowalevskii TaxID=10224 RepID=A0ABM0M971_SACKO|nr:PREDICTED: reticulon-like protein isoform X1 [Saccoglossus kowalevskii]